jgi:uncharacterized protein
MPGVEDIALQEGPLYERFFSPGPKRILALDGGGVRGILTTGILAALESRLARRSGRRDFRLCDYFDLIGGTSTGSIVAAALALGKSTAEVADMYRKLAPEVFASKGRNAGIRKPRFDARRLEAVLEEELGDVTLGSSDLRTGFAVFAKRIDTGSAWTLTNNPRAAYWEGRDGLLPNRNFLIRKLVQASAAAPTFFEECSIKLVEDNHTFPAGFDTSAEFVDGAIAGLNNPSLQMLKVATLKGYGFDWPTGPDRLMVMSIGTGYWRPKLDSETWDQMTLDELAPTAARAIEALKSMIHDTGVQTIATLQGLSQSPRPWRINSEVEDMAGSMISPLPLLHYQRMDARLYREEIEKLGLRFGDPEIKLMRELASDDAATLARLYDIGLRTGEAYFSSAPGEEARNWEKEILPRGFDPAGFSAPLGPPKSKLEALGRAWNEKTPPRRA